MSYKKIGLFVLSAVVTPAAIADLTTVNSYRYLSGGVAFDKNGLASQMKEFDKVKKSSVGGYLQGSYGFDNQLFVEARLGYLGQRQNGYFAGVGYQMPINECSSFYVLGGVSRSNLPKSPMSFRKEDTINFTGGSDTITEKGENYDIQNSSISGNVSIEVGGEKLDLDKIKNESQSSTPTGKQVHEKHYSHLKNNLNPSIELGYKLAVNDQLGVRVAVYCSYDTINLNCSETTISTDPSKKYDSRTAPMKIAHANYKLSVAGNYSLTEQLAFEAGYSWRTLPRLSYDKTSSKMGTVGLRYTF